MYLLHIAKRYLFLLHARVTIMPDPLRKQCCGVPGIWGISTRCVNPICQTFRTCQITEMRSPFLILIPQITAKF
jgi:hypothetical protein